MTNKELLQRLKEGGQIAGFCLEDEWPVKELSCTLWALRHRRSGGRVAFFDVPDEEKCFSLMFPALPEDDTGVLHIIEHCLVQGSEKYPVDDWITVGPQSDFCTAFTCLDTSGYSAVSRIEKSFQDLVRIYTDVVFRPGFLRSEYPMMQEGWHYEYDEKSDALRYGGIVYSEVKAAHDLPLHALVLARLRAAFPGSCYARDIGGAPAYVPQLTREHFLDTYRRFFRPENCLACVWGNACLHDVLDTLAPYFDVDPAGQRPVPQLTPAVWDGSPLRVEYPVQSEEGKQAILSFNWAFPPQRETVVLASAAARLVEGRLAKRLAQSGLCSKVSAACDSETFYPLFTVTLQGAEERRLDEARTEIFAALSQLLETGPSSVELEAAISAAEMALREGPGQVPCGVQAALDAASAFVHDVPLNTYFLYEDALSTLRETGWAALAGFVRSWLLENDWHSEVIMAPSATLAHRRQQAENLRLRAARNRMSQCELEQVREAAKRLKAHQDLPADPAALAALPRTVISDLPKQAPGREIEVLETQKGALLYLDSGEKLMRMTLHFPVRNFGEDYLNRLGVLGLLLGRVGTRSRPLSDVSAAAGISAHGLSARPEWYAGADGDVVYMNVSFAALPDHFAAAQTLLAELLQQSDYSDKDAVYRVLAQYLSAASAALPAPQVRCKAYFSHGAAAEQQYGGLDFRRYVRQLLADFDARFPALCAELQSMAQELYSPLNTMAGLACDRSLLGQAEQNLLFTSGLQQGSPCTAPFLSPREAVRAAGVMQFTAQGARLPVRSGALLALVETGDRILRQKVRERGSAYIVRMRLSPEGDLVLLSGRDPNLRTTLDTFAAMPDILASLSDGELSSGLIAATTAFTDSGKMGISSFKKGEVYGKALRRYLSGFYGAARQNLWEELLAATPGQIRGAVDLLRPMAGQKLYCSWVSEKKLEEDRQLFDSVISE